jgi:DNA polymerase-3 subunit delta'
VYLWNYELGRNCWSKKLIATLKDAIDKQRVSHAQLFIGEEGFGVLPLALAYAKEILKEKMIMLPKK